jgi:hypothetical protein
MKQHLIADFFERFFPIQDHLLRKYLLTRRSVLIIEPPTTSLNK